MPLSILWRRFFSNNFKLLFINNNQYLRIHQTLFASETAVMVGQFFHQRFMELIAGDYVTSKPQRFHVRQQMAESKIMILMEVPELCAPEYQHTIAGCRHGYGSIGYFRGIIRRVY